MEFFSIILDIFNNKQHPENRVMAKSIWLMGMLGLFLFLYRVIFIGIYSIGEILFLFLLMVLVPDWSMKPGVMCSPSMWMRKSFSPPRRLGR